MIAGAPFTIGIMALPDEFSAENYDTTYNRLHRIGYNGYPTQSSPMSIFGGTIGPTSNTYKQDGIIMPRPNAASRPGSKGYATMNEPYVAALAASAEEKMLAYLETHDPDTLKKVRWFKANVPAELRVSGTIFNAMTLVGDLRNGNNHIHIDKNDICSLIIMFGANISGGNTLYYDGPNDKAPGNIVHSEPFAHGKFQVGPFETKVHAGESWKGRRGIISFYVNKQIFDHFQKYGCSLYEQWAPRQDWYERPAVNPMNNSPRSGDTSGLHTGGSFGSLTQGGPCANVVFNLPDVLTTIAENLTPAMVIYSLLGVNTLSTKIALEIREKNNLTPLINRYMLMLDPLNMIPVPKSVGFPVCQLDTDTIMVVRDPSKPTWSSECAGASSVYLNKSGSRSGIGGLTIYDDVISPYPIKIPAHRLADATIQIVGKRQRRFQLSLPAGTTVLDIIARARQALTQLSPADNYAGLQVSSRSVVVPFEDGRYQLLYLSPKKARDFLKSGDSVITLQCTAYDVCWSDDTLVVRNNRRRANGGQLNMQYFKSNLIGLKRLM
eukprot:COSAG01_NODE_1420_length_10367_cov_10.597098_9_plen_551_part_00